MAITSAADHAAVEIVSFVCGFHEYKDIWCPSVGEILDLKREPTNAKDVLAVCIQKDGTVVRHMPCNLAPSVSYFLERPLNTGSVEIAGALLKSVRPKMYAKRLRRLFRKTGTLSDFVSLIID